MSELPAEQDAVDRTPFTAHPSFGLRAIDSRGESMVSHAGGLPVTWLEAPRALRAERERAFFGILLAHLVGQGTFRYSTASEQERATLTSSAVEAIVAMRPDQLTIWLEDDPILECSAAWLGLVVWLTRAEAEVLMPQLEEEHRRAYAEVMTADAGRWARVRARLIKRSDALFTIACVVPILAIARLIAHGVVGYVVAFAILVASERYVRRLRNKVDRRA